MQFDQLNVETPELVDLRFPVAGLGSRFVAALADAAILGLFYLLGIILVVSATGRGTGAGLIPHASSTGLKWFEAVIILINFALVWGYFSLFEGLWHGQTPGKRLLKVRVMKDSGRAATLFEAMARNLLRVVDLLPGFYLAGVITMLTNKSQKRLGDLVAGTIVVHERTDEQPLMSQHQSRSFTANLYEPYERPAVGRDGMNQPSLQLPADAIARLTVADLHLIDTFFSRALDLSVERRAELAGRVAGRLSEKLRLPVESGSNPERLLEAVACQVRAQTRF